jgi:ABC-type sugar transport system substrate-binding protein
LSLGVVSAILVACAGVPAPAETPAAETPAAETPAAEPTDLTGKRIIYVMWGIDNYQQAHGAHLVQAAAADGVEIVLIDGKVDSVIQDRAISDAIAAAPDGLMLWPADAGAAGGTVQRMLDSGIPFILIGSRPVGFSVPYQPIKDYDVTFVAGQNAATWVVNEMGQTPKVVLFDQLTQPYCHEDRMEGFWQGVLSVAPDAELVFRDTVKSDIPTAMERMEDLIVATPDFNIFTACGGDGFVGGMNALVAAGRGLAVDKEPVTEYAFSIDGTPPELEFLFAKDRSLMETMTLTPRENGPASWQLWKDVYFGKIDQRADVAVYMSGQLLPPDCETVAEIFLGHYGVLPQFRPLDC